jgi:8-oxo-dGTP pyrophosphatase MutT (NUDIX family)
MKKIYLNCGKHGHDVKYCNNPITSYGIINVSILDDNFGTLVLQKKFNMNNNYLKIFSRKFPDINCFVTENIGIDKDNEYYKINNDNIPISNLEEFMKFCYYKDRILFLMVNRRLSIGFLEFVRGRYDVTDIRSIINLFEQMYDNEIHMIRNHSYDDILYFSMKKNNGDSKESVLNNVYEGKYSNEYCEAKVKFNILSNPSEYENSNIPFSLQFYTKYIKPRWKNREWGFPKGRRDNRNETSIDCACREFEEETGYTKNEYVVLNRILPIEENLIGTNGINYRHIYYLALNNRPSNTITNNYDNFEIGNVKWVTYHEAMQLIRPYHNDKKNVLTQVYLFLLNFLIKQT